MEQGSSPLGPELTITIAFARANPPSDDPNKTLLSRMLDIEEAGMNTQELNEDQTVLLEALHGFLQNEEVLRSSDGDGQTHSKDGSQQDESDSAFTASSSSTTNVDRKRDVGHTPFRCFKNTRQGYRSPIKLYNPALGAPNAPSSRDTSTSDAILEEEAEGNHELAFESHASRIHPPQYPRIPPESPSSIGSSERDQKSDDGVTFSPVTQVPGMFTTFERTFTSTTFLEKTEVDNETSTTGQTKEQETLKSEEHTKLWISNPVHVSYAHALEVAAAFIPRPHPANITNENEKLPPDFQQVLADLSSRGSNFVPSNEIPNDRASATDECASISTRNEYWSVSSFHSKSQVLEDGNENLGDAAPSPLPEIYQDFELPVESLLKPIKKSTYNPILQEDVQKFLAAGAWHAGPSMESPQEGLWTSKQVPLHPIKVSVGSSSVEISKCQKDGFLESVNAFGADMQFSQKEFFTKYMDSYTYTLNENFVATMGHVKRISTQNTNPPDWYLRRLEQQRAVETKRADTPKTGNLEAQLGVVTPPPILSISRKDCTICFDKVRMEDFPRFTHLSDHSVCTACLRKYLWRQIMKEGTINVNCPGESCSRLLDYDEIKEYGGEAAFTKYDELLCRKVYEEDPNFRWCTNRTCSTGQIIEGEFSSHFTCPSCGFKSCFHCRTPAHFNINCTENLQYFRARQFAADPASGSWLRAYTKPCFCGRWIQKLDGCDHVKCPPRPIGCGEEWCWMCGARYDEIRKVGNTAHKGDCPHYM